MAEQSISKRCSKCKLIKPKIAFYKDKARKDGLYHACKDCESIRDKGRDRKHRLRQRYSLTIEQYEEMFVTQDGVCVICGKPETSKNKVGGIRHLSVDHDHKTGKVRGLLCSYCNLKMGVVESILSDIEFLDKIRKYLKHT